MTATGDGKATMNQVVPGADAKEEDIEEEDEDHGARPRIRHLGEGPGVKEALVINSIETHIGVSINAAIHLSCTKQT